MSEMSVHSGEDGVAGGHLKLRVEIVRFHEIFELMPELQDMGELYLVGRTITVGEVGDGDLLAVAVVPKFRSELLR